MKKVEIIIEGLSALDSVQRERLTGWGRILYELPMIDSLAMELDSVYLPQVASIAGIGPIHENTSITAQMNQVRKAVGAEKSEALGLSGAGIVIALLDTGISPVEDLTKNENRIIAFKDFINGKNTPYDDNGHGTHVAGIAAGNGYNSGGRFRGIAPEASLVGVKILNDEGKGGGVEVLAGLQWTLDHAKEFNIRIINLSIGAEDCGSRDPLVKAVEAAWDMGLVVIVAAGNNGPKPQTVTSPGISKKVITVGASDDDKNVTIWGSALENFSGRGPTTECVIKPDILAPGANIISCLSQTPRKPQEGESVQVIQERYVLMSGTSMATPIVSGSVALLLQKYPDLLPDDIKYMLKKCATNLNHPPNRQGWGLIDLNNLLQMEGLHVR